MSGLPDEVRYVAAFAIALAVTMAATPLARRIAIRTRFYDRPEGYKQHARATPYLGGVAVMAGFLVGSGATTDDLVHLLPLVAAALGLHVLGTLDDRRILPVAPRLVGQAAAGVLLWETGWGWAVFESGAADLAITVLWVMGVVNGFNLMDNLDGAASAVASVSALGVASLALLHDQTAAALAVLAIAGACGGFLPFNLARPSRIFLGDGGSMPIGLVIAAAIMSVPNSDLGWVTPIASAPLAGLVLFDTALVLAARRRRGAKLLRGARDHTTHRLLPKVGSELAVAVWLAAVQAALCGLALVLNELDQLGALQGAAACGVVGLIAIRVFEGPRPARWRERAPADSAY